MEDQGPTSRSKKVGDGFAITSVNLSLNAKIPGADNGKKNFQELAGYGQGRMSGVEALQYQDHAGCEADVIVVIPGRVERREPGISRFPGLVLRTIPE